MEGLCPGSRRVTSRGVEGALPGTFKDCTEAMLGGGAREEYTVTTALRVTVKLLLCLLSTFKAQSGHSGGPRSACWQLPAQMAAYLQLTFPSTSMAHTQAQAASAGPSFLVTGPAVSRLSSWNIELHKSKQAILGETTLVWQRNSLSTLELTL